MTCCVDPPLVHSVFGRPRYVKLLISWFDPFVWTQLLVCHCHYHRHRAPLSMAVAASDSWVWIQDFSVGGGWVQDPTIASSTQKEPIAPNPSARHLLLKTLTKLWGSGRRQRPLRLPHFFRHFLLKIAVCISETRMLSSTVSCLASPTAH